MNDRQNQRQQMFIPVPEFFAPRKSDFSETGMVRQLFTQLKATITNLDRFSGAQASG